MKQVALILLFFIILSPSLLIAETEEWDIEIESIPQSVEDFISMRNSVAVSPGGGAAMFVVAMVSYAQNTNGSMDVFVASLVNDNSMLKKSNKDTYGGKIPSNNAKYLIQRIDQALYLPNSYFIRTSPETGYSLPDFPLRIHAYTNVHSYIKDDTVKVYVCCSGADSARPVTLVRNNRGIWKVKEFSSLVVGIRSPVENFDDEL